MIPVKKDKLVKSNIGAEHKWCSVHKTALHDDTYCHKQRAPRPPQSGHALTASAIRGASTRANDDEKPSLLYDDGFEEAFAFTGQVAVAATGVFTPIATGSRYLWTAATAALRFRSTNTQRTRVYAVTTCFFATWAARLICHQRLL